MRRSSAGRLTPPGKHTGASRAPEHTARDAADARAGHVLEPVRLTRDDGLRCAQPAADRRSDALTQVAGREPRGVPGDEGVVAADHGHAPAQVVAVAAGIVVGARRAGRWARRAGRPSVPAARRRIRSDGWNVARTGPERAAGPNAPATAGKSAGGADRTRGPYPDRAPPRA